jgi:hypothetical protein
MPDMDNQSAKAMNCAIEDRIAAMDQLACQTFNTVADVTAVGLLEAVPGVTQNTLPEQPAAASGDWRSSGSS